MRRPGIFYTLLTLLIGAVGYFRPARNPLGRRSIPAKRTALRSCSERMSSNLAVGTSRPRACRRGTQGNSPPSCSLVPAAMSLGPSDSAAGATVGLP